MKKYLAFICLLFLLAGSAKAQYWTNGGEIIFSWADYRDSNDTKISGPPRFTVFLHLNYNYNIDLGRNLGFALGLGMRNIGFITRNETFLSPGEESNQPLQYSKIKRRSYSLGVPFMLKIGNVKKDRFLALGAEYEMFFHFKEKLFRNGNKIKRKEFMSDEVNRFVPSVFVGLQFSDVGMIKVQYYLADFFNTDYKYSRDGGLTYIRPYANTTSQMFFISYKFNIRMEKIKNRDFGKNTKEAKARRLFGNIRVNH